MPLASNADVQPFETLDRDWTLICRQHQRSNAIARWAAAEPSLASIRRLSDVIPPTHIHRTPITNAVARLHVGGDDLAGRALLQLLIPGMIRLTARWRTQFSGGVSEAGWEVITRTAVYIALLREREISCAPAGYVLCSVHRDLGLELRYQQQRLTAEHAAAVADGPHGVAPSAEDVVSSRTVVRLILEGAVDAGVLPAEAVEMLWLVLSGHSVNDAAARTSTPASSGYRYAARTFAHLYEQLFSTDRSETGR